jgi:hypothetical protein
MHPANLLNLRSRGFPASINSEFLNVLPEPRRRDTMPALEFGTEIPLVPETILGGQFLDGATGSESMP